MSIELHNRLSLGQNAVNIDGTDKRSPIRELAHGQEGVTVAVDKYLAEKNRIILSKRFSAEGTKDEILKIGEATVKEIQNIGEKMSNRAKADLARLENALGIGNDEDETPDWLKGRLFDKLDSMQSGKRIQFATKAVVDGNMPLVRAVFDYAALFPDTFTLDILTEWKSVFAKARKPLIAEEFATLSNDIEKFRFTTAESIRQVTDDAGVGKNTLRDRMNSANDLIKESELRRTESSEDQKSGKNVRSEHTPNTPVTV